jgi:hypothetical protein
MNKYFYVAWTEDCDFAGAGSLVSFILCCLILLKRLWIFESCFHVDYLLTRHVGEHVPLQLAATLKTQP